MEKGLFGGVLLWVLSAVLMCRMFVPVGRSLGQLHVNVFWVQGSCYRRCSSRSRACVWSSAWCTAGLYEIIDSSMAQLFHCCFLEETDWVHQLNPQTCGLYSNTKWGGTVNKLSVWLDLFWYMPNLYSGQVHPLGSLPKLLLWPLYQPSIPVPPTRGVGDSRLNLTLGADSIERQCLWEDK